MEGFRSFMRLSGCRIARRCECLCSFSLPETIPQPCASPVPRSVVTRSYDNEAALMSNRDSMLPSSFLTWQIVLCIVKEVPAVVLLDMTPGLLPRIQAPSMLSLRPKEHTGR